MDDIISVTDEIWKDIKGYEGIYRASSFGRIKSLDRSSSIGRSLKGKILSTSKDARGYLKITLCRNGVIKTHKIHKLVAIAFLDHVPYRYNLVVNHKDFNRLNNKVDNLEIVTNRENCNHKHIKSTSKYTGVSWRKDHNKWESAIHVKGKRIHFGYFISEIEASKAYEEYLNELENKKL